MHHFEGNDFQNPTQYQNQPHLQNQPTGPATFRSEYNGVLTGLMSSVQLAYTGVSVIYFVQNIKGMFSDFKEFILPILKKALSFLSPKAAAFYIFKALNHLFAVNNLSTAVLKIGFLGAFLGLLYMYVMIKKKETKLLERKIEKAKEKIITKNSEEYWQN